jgi:hypothetical protein
VAVFARDDRTGPAAHYRAMLALALVLGWATAPTPPPLPELQRPGMLASDPSDPRASEGAEAAPQDPEPAAAEPVSAMADPAGIATDVAAGHDEPEALPLRGGVTGSGAAQPIPRARAIDEERPGRADRLVEVRPPTWRGTGLFATSGVLFGITAMMQAGDFALCDGECLMGFTERALLAGTMAAAATGGAIRGRADAYDDAVVGYGGRRVGTAIAVGGALVGAGAVVGIANDVVYWRCFGTFTGCNPVRTRILLDLGAAMVAAGGALLAYGLRARADRRFYRRARAVSVGPFGGRQTAGVAVGGRF